MRKRLGLVLGISLCLSASTYALAAATFRVLSYNVENLWDDEPENTPDVWRKFLASLPEEDRDHMGSRSLQYKDYSEEFSNWYTPEILDTKIQHLVSVIKLAGEPEILAFQEIESAGNESNVFDMRGKKFVLRAEFEKLGYHYFNLGHQNKKNPVSVTQAIISKIPLTALDSVNIEFEEEPYSQSARDIQVVEYREANNRMLIFNNHWKSKMGGKKTELVRIRTAEILKQRIAEEKKIDPDTRIIVLGDLNSSYYEKPILALASGDENKMLKDKTATLYNTWYELSDDDRWETSFRGERQTLSAMLISDDFYLKGGIQYVDQSFHIVGQTGAAAKKLLNADGTPFRWQVKKEDGFSTHIGKGYSDHLPLVASFKIENGDTTARKTKIVLSHTPASPRVDKVFAAKLDKVPLCTSDEIKDIKTLDFQSDDWFNQCVRIEGSFPLQGTQKGGNNFIDVKNPLQTLRISLAMTRSWDDRPNVDDSRVMHSIRKVHTSRNGSPRSNKCFHRKVLRGEGGTLVKAVGRLGYNEGKLAVFIASREEKNIVLKDLPEAKRLACPWDSSVRK